MEKLPQVIASGKYLENSRKSNVQRALDDRVTFSEAAQIAASIVDQFPSTKNSADGFLGGIAQVISQYPRQVVLKCADPVRGYARDHEFLAISNLIGWCEKLTEPMRVDVSREKRIEEQLKAREEWEDSKPTPRLKEMGKSWLNRTDPIARELTGHNNAAEHQQKQAMLDQIQAANQKVFMREHQKAGTNPALGVSASLLKIIGENNDLSGNT